jgi:hypothetical protein
VVEELSGNRIKSIAAGDNHSIALSLTGIVYTYVIITYHVFLTM